MRKLLYQLLSLYLSVNKNLSLKYSIDRFSLADKIFEIGRYSTHEN